MSTFTVTITDDIHPTVGEPEGATRCIDVSAKGLGRLGIQRLVKLLCHAAGLEEQGRVHVTALPSPVAEALDALRKKQRNGEDIFAGGDPGEPPEDEEDPNDPALSRFYQWRKAGLAFEDIYRLSDLSTGVDWIEENTEAFAIRNALEWPLNVVADKSVQA